MAFVSCQAAITNYHLQYSVVRLNSVTPRSQLDRLIGYLRTPAGMANVPKAKITTNFKAYSGVAPKFEVPSRTWLSECQTR